MVKYFSDLISDSETKNIIYECKNVILDGGTNTGKTSYIINHVSKISERVLYLVPRLKLKESVESELSFNKVSNVDVITYQSVEHYISNNNKCNYELSESILVNKYCSTYDVIVFDEVHCILTDSAYDQYTEYIYNLMVRLMKCDVSVILMSATAGTLFDMFIDNLVDSSDVYHIDPDYSYLYCTPVRSSEAGIISIIYELIRTSTPEEKIMFFTSSKKRGFDYYREFSSVCDVTFACSKYSQPYNIEKNNMIDSITNTFPGKLLISTTALDVGINLTDKNIRYIVTDIFDIDSMIQCLGRRRVKPKEFRNGEGDPVYLYFRNWNRNSVQFIKRSLEDELAQIELFENDPIGYNEKFFKRDFEKSKYIYYNMNDWYLNCIGKIKLTHDIDNINNISDVTLKCVLEQMLIGAKMYDMEDYSDKRQTIREYILPRINVRLGANEREELISIIDLRDSRNRKQRSFKMIATYLEEHYQVMLESERVSIDGIRETYWIIKSTESTYDFINRYYSAEE